MAVAGAAGASGVMQLVLSLDPGGAERLVVEMTKFLAPRVRTVVCCLDRPGGWAREVESSGVDVLTIGREPGFHPSLGLRIAQLARLRRVGVVHCHQYTPFVYGRLATLRSPALRLVFTEHGRLSDAPPSPKRRLVNALLARLPGAVCAVCEDLKRHLVSEGFPPAAVRVVYNGIDPGPRLSQEARVAARQKLGLSNACLVVGTVARLDPVKNLGVLIDAFGAVRSVVPGVQLIVVGDGPERQSLENQSRETGCGSRVHFLGHRDDTRSILPALDVFVNTSVSEGMSVTILEAMAASLPVVATSVGGNPELVVDGETGVLVPARSPASTAQALSELCAAPERLRAMGAAGRARVEAHFTLERMVGQYMKLYGVGEGG